jgi:hypothetical protein
MKKRIKKKDCALCFAVTFFFPCVMNRKGIKEKVKKNDSVPVKCQNGGLFCWALVFWVVAQNQRTRAMK